MTYQTDKHRISFYSFCLYVSHVLIFGDAYGTYRFGSVFRYCSVALLSLIVIISFWNKYLCNPSTENKWGSLISFVALSFLLLSYPFWFSLYNAYAYAGIPVAFFLYLLDKKELNRILIILLIISLILAVYETIIRDYLFSNEMIKNGELVVYDTKTAGGITGVFRAKALFYGSLSLGLFALGVAFFFPNNFLVMTLAFITAFLAGTRLAIVFIILLIYINPSLKIEKKIFHLLLFSMVFLLIFFIIRRYDSASLERILNVFNVDGGTHDNRIIMWRNGIYYFSEYSLIHLIFGYNGYFLNLFANNSESGWITLLTDLGMLGFFLYLIPQLYLFVSFLKKSKYHMATVVLLFVMCNSFVTFNLSMTGNLIYWICIFRFYDILQESKNTQSESMEDLSQNN